MNENDLIPIIAASFSESSHLGFEGETGLRDFLAFELGRAEAFSQGVEGPGAIRCRAMAPTGIYHVLASNLDVSAETSLVLGLLSQSPKLVFKLPGSGLPGFEARVSALPEALRNRVRLIREHDAQEMASCEAVVVFGSDKTVEAIHRQCHWRQRFLGYGHKLSLGILPSDTDDFTPWATKATEEIIAYEQSGCLSPQLYLCENPAALEPFAKALALALEAAEQKNPLSDVAPKAGSSPMNSTSSAWEGEVVQGTSRAPLSSTWGGKCWEGWEGWEGWEESGAIFTARQEALSRGWPVLASEGSTAWTVVIQKEQEPPVLEAGPGRRFIHVAACVEVETFLLNQPKGLISAVSIAAETPERFAPSLVHAAGKTGASRICRMGDLQRPPLTWRHDGRPRLADLVRWQTIG